MANELRFNPERFAMAVKLRRKWAGLSRAELCELTGLSTATVQKIEDGSTAPEMATFAKLLNWLELDANDFFTREK